jgi:hypothetical protein
MFATLFHDSGFRSTPVEALLTRHGPCSWNKPIMLELPGPPLNQTAKGAVEGFERAAKNQKLREKSVNAFRRENECNHKRLLLEVRSPYPDA